VLPQYYKNIYHGSYHGKMVFRDELAAAAYYHSMLSMKEFFDPPLSEEELREAYDAIVAPIVRRDIDTLGQFEDYIQRDFFICNDNPKGFNILDPEIDDARTIKGYNVELLGADYAKAA
ncbi:MAG TPA: hypothetical protein VG964_01140, partial [Candidatus Saccharimonadales bacterium]|nr:hypothetical protein [Candidatus Saccharimonadales bacterium]